MNTAGHVPVSSRHPASGEVRAGREAMARYLPQRNPMVLLDALLEDLPTSVTCKCTLDDGFAFLQAGKVDALALIEVAAQTAAVYISIHAQTPVVGFLASCREATFDVAELALGDVLEVRAELLSGGTGSGAFGCVVTRAGVRCAEMHLILVDPGWGAVGDGQ